MKICFIDVLGLTYDGSTLSKRGLGGSESAIILLTKQLVKLGFSVTVFNDCFSDESRPGVYEGVVYKPLKEIENDYQWDCVISSRSVAPFCQKGQVPLRHDYQNVNFELMQVNSNYKVYWMHDTFSDGDLLVEQLVTEGKINEIFTLTDWHTSYVTNCDHGRRRNFDVLKNHIFQTRNGIGAMNPGWVDCKLKDPDLFVFNSSVTKGMVPLVKDVWPRVKDKIPNAKLKVIGGYYRFRSDHGPDQQELDWRQMVNDHPDVDFLGVISQQEISAILRQASFMIYPCGFPETFGISTLEALAHNVPIITCRFGGLEETALDIASYKINYPVEPNWSVPWLQKPEQIEKFVETVCYAHSTKYLHQQKMYACNQVKQICGWDSVALQWKQHLYNKTGRFLPLSEYKKVQQINHDCRKIFGRRFYNLEELQPPQNSQQRIVVITPTYNSEKYIEKCIESVYQQDYENYEHIIINDCSTDQTAQVIEKNKHDKLRIITNNKNRGAVYNQVYTIKEYCNSQDIIMLVDGDDWLVNDPQLFHKFNNMYHNGAEFTYGSMWSLVDNIPLIAQPYPPDIKQKKQYRQYKFNWNMPYTHLRTFRAKYLHRVDDENFMRDGQWMRAGGDNAVFYNTIEQVDPDSVVCCPDVVYYYNDTNPINDYKINSEEQTMNANYVLNNGINTEDGGPKYSVIMPTMWRCWELTETVLTKLQDHPLIDEIIIINNDVERTPTSNWHPKIKMLNQPTNIRVNPAWNLGVEKSRNDLLCIINDDIDFDTHLLNRLRYKITPNNGAFGLITGENHFNHPETTDYSIDFIKWRPGDNIHCFGQLMFMHKQNWVPIIDGLDIYFGDDFIFHNHLKRGLDNYLIYNIQFYSPMSQTCKDLSISGGFYEKEKPVWEKYFSENPLTLMDQHHNDPIVRLYHEQVNTPSDINEHLPKLLELAKQCDSITEFGVRHGRSTTAFISSGIKLTSYDIEETVEARMLFDVAKSLGKPCEYIVDPVKGNSLLVDIDETDLLFIDTIHSYEQLSKELAKHHSKVNKFICVHDTHIFGYEWQPHFEWPVYQHFHNQGTHQKGLLHAIIDFLIKHPEWKIKHHSVINNGLTVLQRSVDRLPTPVVADELPEQNNLKKILVAIPTARYIEPETFKAIYDLECPEGCELHFQYFYGYNVDQVRNLIASWVINGFDYLFAVDHDIVFAPDTLVKMVKHNKPLVTGIYRQRLLEQHIEIYDFNLKRIVYEDLPENSLVEIGGCGMGCCLISKEVFVAIEYPHYKYYSALDHNHTFSEDLDFCRKARLKGFSLFCDTSIVCDHHGQTVYRVEKKNVSSSKPSVVNNEEITKRFIELSEMDLLCNEHKNYLWSLKGRGFEPKVIYDIGSSTLHWAKFAREVWPNSKIILFEAMQEVEMLYKLNGFDQYHLGVLSSYNNNGKTIDFYQNLYHPGGNSYYRENVQYSSTADLLFAPEGSKVKKIASSLDSVVKMRNFPEPDLIKIDCQGAELDILNGMEKVKAGIGCRNIIIEAQNIEYNLGAPNKQEVFEFMDQCGYEMVAKITNLQVDNDYHFRLRS